MLPTTGSPHVSVMKEKQYISMVNKIS
jgi:hypothetical protein